MHHLSVVFGYPSSLGNFDSFPWFPHYLPNFPCFLYIYILVLTDLFSIPHLFFFFFFFKFLLIFFFFFFFFFPFFFFFFFTIIKFHQIYFDLLMLNYRYYILSVVTSFPVAVFCGYNMCE